MLGVWKSIIELTLKTHCGFRSLESSLFLFESCLYFPLFSFTLVTRENGLICQPTTRV